MKLRAPFLPWVLALVGCSVAVSCDSSSGGGEFGGFQLVSMSVQQGQLWRINRPVDFVFSDPIDFSSVDQNTIKITDASNKPATGSFSLVNPRTVRFQPRCPLRSDFQDAGFLPGGVTYSIEVLGEFGGSGISLRSASGGELQNPQLRSFVTPNSTLLTELFQDAVSGAPLPVVRTVGSVASEATYVELGGDASQRIYFELDSATQTTSRPGSGDGSLVGTPYEEFEDGLPLNLYSQETSRVVVFVELNQPVNPSPANISASRIRLEAETALGSNVWTRLQTQVELFDNCTDTGGATVRLEAVGPLKQGVGIRVFMAAEFEDLAGNRHLAPVTGFARFQTRMSSVELADEVLEEFDVGAVSPSGMPVPESLEDRNAVFAEPRAVWGVDGVLRPAFGFDGTGGPSGSFDFVVSQNTTIRTDTPTTIFNSNQTLQQTVVNGRLDVRNLTIQPGVTLTFTGSRRATVNVSGSAVIEGVLALNGFNAKDVAGVATATQPEPGAIGAASGGTGGTASALTSSSTPQGGAGFGPFFDGTAQPGLGGQGGETGFGLEPGKNETNSNPAFRRGGGGGGGSLGSGLTGMLAAEAGDPGSGPPPNNPSAPNPPLATGAITGMRPFGGSPGPEPFVDSDPTNDFFGTQFIPATMTEPERIIRGELARPTAGTGGGAGGDSTRSNTFPANPFSNASEDKGGAGGGGGGSLHLKALGQVSFGMHGKISANGGNGAHGQLIGFQGNFFTPVGAGGGGGSGGHIIIEAPSISFHPAATVSVEALGGLGAERTAGPPAANPIGGGGDGGGGLIQLHTPNGLADITAGAPLDMLCQPPPKILVPSFGALSRARSKWITLGGAVGGLPDDVTFCFDGIDTMTGEVEDLDADEKVDDLPPLLGDPMAIELNGDGVTPPYIDPLNSRRLVFDTTDPLTELAGDDVIYRDNPALLRGFVVEIRNEGPPPVFQRYVITSARLLPSDPDLMEVTVDRSGGSLTDILLLPRSFRIFPRFFGVITGGTKDSLPANSAVRIQFQGTGIDVNGNPNENNILVDWTSDITALSLMPATPVRFMRFEVEFDLDAGGTGMLSATTPRPSLEFLRVPFKF